MSVIVSAYAWMCSSLTPELLDRFYSYLEYKSLFIADLCLTSVKFLAPIKKAPQMGRRTQNVDILDNVSNEFHSISVVYGNLVHS